MQIGKTFSFEAAHYLPSHQGKCANLHGHSYKAEVVIAGPVVSDRQSSCDGMVVDFAEVSARFKERVFAELDHRCLNEVISSGFLPTTAENIARFILVTMAAGAFESNPSATIESVTVWETATSWARATL